MKIGINATFLSERPTGLGVFTQEISRQISARNRDLVVFSPVAVEGVSEDLIRKVPAAITGSLRFRDNLLRFMYLNTRLPLLCRSSKVDVLFCPMIEFPFVPLVPLVVHVHDLHPVKFASQFGLSSVHFRISLNVIEKSSIRVTVVSEFVKKELLRETDIPENRIDVVLNGYNKNRFYPRPPQEKKEFLRKYSLGDRYLLFVGNVFPYKNVTLLIETFLRIKEKIPHDLVIAGRREFFSGTLPRDERVRYIDYVPHEDLPGLYSYADMLIHPSLSEGFGLTPLEAMACGTPVICSNSTSLPEVVGGAGLLFEPTDGSALVELILAAAGNEELRQELSAKGLKRAELFSWDKTATGILESCRKALEEKL